MKNKILKIAFTFVLFSILFVTSSFATTVKENAEDYAGGAYIIGSTRFEPDVIITASLAANAGINEAKVNLALGNDISNLKVAIYSYDSDFEEWNEVKEDGTTRLLEETEAETLEENLNIFFVNNVEKTLEIEYTGDVDTTSITNNVTYANGKFSVPATTFSFKFSEVKEENGEKVVVAKEVSTNIDKNVTTGTEVKPNVDKVSENFVARVGSEYFEDLVSAIEQATTEDEVVLLKDIDLPTAIEITKKVTINLNNCNLTVKEDTEGNGVFYIPEGGDLTINGEGIVDGVGKNKYNIVVWANGGDLTINGGTYTNKDTVILPEDTDAAHFDVIYAKGDSKILVTGGRFEGITPQWLLNINKASTDASITVTGGTFVGCNPLNMAETEGAGFVDTEKYKIEENGNEYTVVELEEDDIAISNGIAYKNLQEAVNKVEAGLTIKLLKDIDLPTAVEITKKVTINLNNCKLTVKEDTEGNGVFYIPEGGDLTINGEGIVDGVGKNKYNIVVWANGGDLTINGGTYTNKDTVILPEDTDAAHFDVIYAKGDSKILVTGGRFEGITPQWLLNINKASTDASITVTGGTFVGCNPLNMAETEGAGFVDTENYKVEVNGNEYTVIEK